MHINEAQICCGATSNAELGGRTVGALRFLNRLCRRVEEARKVIDAIAQHGLRRGQNGLEVFMVCEIPNNVILIDQFAKLFDGFSIGSNDLIATTTTKGAVSPRPPAACL